MKEERFKPLFLLIIELVSALFFILSINKPNNKLLASIISPIPGFLISRENKRSSEIFGFAPHWKINSLDNVDFSTLTTLAYFDVKVNSDGTLDKDDPGYTTFISDKATEIFNKAHKNGTKVVLTLTAMDNSTILSLMDDSKAQKRLIEESIVEVKNRRIEGINVDFEFVGDPGQEYRNKFSNFVSALTNKLHNEIQGSNLTVSVYASSVKDPKIYDIRKISDNSDGIFMMAYDFAVKGSDNAIPTAPLYGHKEGKYWYDVSTAVEDFLKIMPSEKLILGVPWYGYDYAVNEPGVNATTAGGYSYWYKHWISSWYWVWRRAYYRAPSIVQTYATSLNEVKADKTGWDNFGKVGWKAYKDDDGTWRMFFMEDAQSLGAKYDFAKNKNLKGVGIWALGFDEGKSDMWNLLKQKFGTKLVENVNLERSIQ